MWGLPISPWLSVIWPLLTFPSLSHTHNFVLWKLFLINPQELPSTKYKPHLLSSPHLNTPCCLSPLMFALFLISSLHWHREPILTGIAFRLCNRDVLLFRGPASSTLPSTTNLFVRHIFGVQNYFSSQPSPSLKRSQALYGVYLCLDVAGTQSLSPDKISHIYRPTFCSSYKPLSIHACNKFIIFPPKYNNLYLLGNQSQKSGHHPIVLTFVFCSFLHL